MNQKFFDLAYYVFDNYTNNREKSLTRLEKEIAALKVQCAESARRSDLLEQFSQQFLEEKKKIDKLAMKALDIAMVKGDAEISEIALAILEKESSKDFFGMMNKISGLR